MENTITQVQENDNDGNRIQDAQYRDCKLNQLAQANIGNNEAEQADDCNITVILHFFLEYYVEVTGNRAGYANTGSQASEENNQRQNYFAIPTKIMVGNTAQHLTTVLHQTKQANTGSTHICQRAINNCQEACSNNTGINAQFSQSFGIQNAFCFDSIDGSCTKKHGSQKVHGVITFLEPFEERNVCIITNSTLNSAHGFEDYKGNQNTKAQQKHRSQNFADVINNLGRINRQEISYCKKQEAINHHSIAFPTSRNKSKNTGIKRNRCSTGNCEERANG